MKTGLAVVGGIVLLFIIGTFVAGFTSDDQSSTTGVTPATPQTQDQQPVDPGKVEVKSHQQSQEGTYPSIVGEIINNTASGATFVQVTATLYDSEGQVVDTDFTYAGSDVSTPIQAGATAPFEVVFLDKPEFDTYKLDVTWN